MNIKSLKEKIGHLYNKVSCRKESAVEYVRRKCDARSFVVLNGNTFC